MAVTGRWFVTPHAVNRYIERVDRKLSYDDALAHIIKDSELARFVRQLPDKDGIRVELWRGKRPHRVRYTIVDSTPLPIVVTLKKGTQ